MKFVVMLNNTTIAEVSGIDYAYEVYRKTCELAELLCGNAYLVDCITGEIIADNEEE